MQRAFHTTRVRENKVYASSEVRQLYNIHPNTLSNWIKDGLRPSPCGTPHVFRGSELLRFHKERHAASRQPLRPGEMLCLVCKSRVRPEMSTIVLGEDRSTPSKARCPDCTRPVTKILDETEYDTVAAAFKNNTTPEYPDEGKAGTRGDIGKNLEALRAKAPSPNDRLIYDWQVSAGHLESATVDAYLHAIRNFEDFLSGKPFGDLEIEDCASFREHLKRLQETGRLSTSSVRHRASQVAKFLSWLLDEPAGKHLNRNIIKALQLPKKFAQRGIERERPYPTIEQAVEMLAGMPDAEPHEALRKALFALICLTGLRAGAVTSLLRRDLDIDRKTVRQDAGHMRAKNGKSFVVYWFDIPDVFEDCLSTFVRSLDGHGLRPSDALFPLDADLKQLVDGTRAASAFSVRRTPRVATEAFAIASKSVGAAYTPHSARDMLVALGGELCTTYEEHKAWSQNLGHDEIVTTERYYGRMDRKKVGATLQSVGQAQTGQGQTDGAADLKPYDGLQAEFAKEIWDVFLSFQQGLNSNDETKKGEVIE
ncbi:tyrosine-type recombinase/integrase [Celeribacter sp.]|uniref:tyrosine-type recombinase/integrase n=1 Tax=Celeribacter sp. TaxID=1890673 RepID=UPI003A8D2F32